MLTFSEAKIIVCLTGGDTEAGSLFGLVTLILSSGCPQTQGGDKGQLLCPQGKLRGAGWTQETWVGEREGTWSASGEEMETEPEVATEQLVVSWGRILARNTGKKVGRPAAQVAWGQIATSETGWRISAEPGFKDLQRS